MNKMTKIAAAVALITGAVTATPVMAENDVAVSANVGSLTDYYFRGIHLGDAGAFGGADVEYAGFYAGVWGVDDGGGVGEGDSGAGDDGMEVDFYAGYGYEFENGLALGVGYTRYDYTYTSDFEDEINLSAGFAGFEVTYADGTGHWDKEDSTGEEADYKFWTVGYSGEIFGVLYGKYKNEGDDSGDEYSYDYVEISASGEVAGLDVTATLGKTRNVEEEIGGVNSDLSSGDGYFVLAVSKSFDL